MINPLSAIFELVNTGVDIYQKKKQAVADREIAEIKAGSDWEVAAMQNSGKWLRRVSYALFSFPIVLTGVNPDAGAQLFKNLDSAPDWYIQTFMIINGAVWGVAELKRFAPGIRRVLKK